MTPAPAIRLCLAAVAAAVLVSCGQPWQPLTHCPDADRVSAATGISDLDLLDSSANGERADFIACNYDVTGTEPEPAIARVSIGQFRGDALQKIDELDLTVWDQPTVESPVGGATTYFYGGRVVVVRLDFDDGRLQLQFVQPDAAPPLSDRDAASRASQLARAVGLPIS